MNLRILKKRSKQAAPYLGHFQWFGKEQFLAERGENHHGLDVRCPHKPGRFRCGCHYHPLKGTPMVGAMSGYYEPEWDERTAFEELVELVKWDERPASLSDADWERILRITRAKPIILAELEEWARETLAEPA